MPGFLPVSELDARGLSPRLVLFHRVHVYVTARFSLAGNVSVRRSPVFLFLSPLLLFSRRINSLVVLFDEFYLHAAITLEILKFLANRERESELDFLPFLYLFFVFCVD